MAFSHDYMMRQIEDIAQFLGKTLFQKQTQIIPMFDEQGNLLASGFLFRRLCDMLEKGEVNQAENILFDAIEKTPTPEYLQVGLQFYQKLQAWSAQKLEAAHFTPAEILDGLQEIKALCGEGKTKQEEIL